MNMHVATSPSQSMPLPPSMQAGADPIFAAIETHRAAVVRYYADLTAENAATEISADIMNADAIGRELAKVVPTTAAGAAALIDYVDATSNGAVCVGECTSGYETWPVRMLNDPDGKQGDNNETAAPFFLHILRNVAATLPAATPPSPPATTDDYAAAQFEVWPPFAGANGERLVSTEQMKALRDHLLVAYGVVLKDRSALLECVERDKDGTVIGALVDTLEGCHSLLSGLAEMVEAAQTRLFIAAAAHEKGERPCR